MFRKSIRFLEKYGIIKERRKNMDKWRYAIWYCENHECKDCYIYKNDLDSRTKEECRLHTPCCENIHDYLVRNNLDSLPE